MTWLLLWRRARRSGKSGVIVLTCCAFLLGSCNTAQSPTDAAETFSSERLGPTVISIAPIVGVPEHVYPTPTPQEGYSLFPFEEGVRLEGIRFLVETDGRPGDIYWGIDDEQAERLAALPSSQGFSTSEGQTRFLVQVSLPNTTGCRSQRRDFPLAVWAQGQHVGGTIETARTEYVATLRYDGDCARGHWIALDAQRFDPHVEYLRD